jgi:hypothetical protein
MIKLKLRMVYPSGNVAIFSKWAKIGVAKKIVREAVADGLRVKRSGSTWTLTEKVAA